jgi:transcriptional regulator with XRE-family HTH domain
MANDHDSSDFARVFGSALAQFLNDTGISQTEAVRRLGLELNQGKARLNTYCRGHRDGSWPTPDARILYLLCTKLGFAFKYNGYIISAASLNGNGAKPAEKPVEQLLIDFNGQFNLTDQTATGAINVKRRSGRIDVAISLKSAS